MLLRPATPIVPCLLAVLLTLASFNSDASAATLTVGNDGTCDYTNLASAISAAADGDTLQLANTTFTGSSGVNFNIFSKTLFLNGGYIGCTGVRTNTQTTLEGQGADSVVEISGTGSHVIILSQLVIRGGLDDADDGGGIEIDGDFDVFLMATAVVANDSDQGGGIHIDGSQGATLSVLASSSIGGNFALTGSGGGIYCEGGAFVQIQDGVQVDHNIAAQDGGGIYANDCEVLIVAQSGFDGIFIISNEASNNGGAMAFVNSLVNVDGGQGAKVRINSNTADEGGSSGDGGGVYADAGSTVFMSGVLIQNNQAGDEGGGLYAEGSSTIQLEDDVCSVAKCQVLHANSAYFGGAVAADSGGIIGLSETWVTDNEALAPSGEGAIAYSISSGIFDFQNSMVIGNRGPGGLGSPLSVNGGNLEIEDSTFVGHTNLGFLISGSGNLTIQNSIFRDNDGAFVDSAWSGSIVVHCAVLDPGALAPAGATEISHVDPQFVSATDPHLTQGSPVIDLCVNNTESLYDLDHNARPLGARRDPGADELVPPIFVDGFESGDTSAWSGGT